MNRKMLSITASGKIRHHEWRHIWRKELELKPLKVLFFINQIKEQTQFPYFEGIMY